MQQVSKEWDLSAANGPDYKICQTYPQLLYFPKSCEVGISILCVYMCLHMCVHVSCCLQYTCNESLTYVIIYDFCVANDYCRLFQVS